MNTVQSLKPTSKTYRHLLISQAVQNGAQLTHEMPKLNLQKGIFGKAWPHSPDLSRVPGLIINLITRYVKQAFFNETKLFVVSGWRPRIG